MSDEVTYVFQKAPCATQAVEPRRVTRFELPRGELFIIPRSRRFLQVLSGDAWVSMDERDIVAVPGDCVKLPQTRFPTMVSGLAGQSLLLEIW